MEYLYKGWTVSIREGVLVNGMECYLPNGVLVYGMGSRYMVWGVSNLV